MTCVIHPITTEAVILENVLGIRRVLPDVLRTLRETGPYVIAVGELDPCAHQICNRLCHFLLAFTVCLRLDYGENGSRRRLYIFMVRKDALDISCSLNEHMLMISEKMKVSATSDWLRPWGVLIFSLGSELTKNSGHLSGRTFCCPNGATMSREMADALCVRKGNRL